MCIRSLRLGFVSRFILKMRSLRCWGVREILSIGGRLSVAGWIWRLYHATGDGRLFNYPVHLSRPPSKDAEQPQPTLPISPGVRCASTSCMLAYSCKVTGEAYTILPPSQNQGGGDENNSSSVGFDDSSTAAWQWGCATKCSEASRSDLFWQERQDSLPER